MSLPKWIKDQFVEPMKDEDFKSTVITYDTHTKDEWAVIEDLLREEIYDAEGRYGYIYINRENSDFYYVPDVLKPGRKTLKLIIGTGNVAYDPNLGMHRVSGVPENATHYDGGRWVEYRKLTDEEYANQEEIRKTLVQDCINSLIKWLKAEAKQNKKNRLAAEKLEKSEKALLNSKPKLRKIELSMTDEQFAQFQSLFEE